MDDTIEFADEECPKCGKLMYIQPCPVIGCDDGLIDVYDEDPLWYSPGDVEKCHECNGHGHVIWCRSCGYCATDPTIGDDTAVSIDPLPELPDGFDVSAVRRFYYYVVGFYTMFRKAR